MIKEAERRKKENKPPILNEEQMLELAKQDPNNDIVERDELILGKCFKHKQISCSANSLVVHFGHVLVGRSYLGWRENVSYERCVTFHVFFFSQRAEISLESVEMFSR